MKPDVGILDFQLSRSFHKRLLSPGPGQQPKLSFNSKKVPHLPSDHPEVQGVREVPAINANSIRILEKKAAN